MARRKRRKHRNPDGAKSVVIALAVGVGVYLLIRMLQKKGMLGNGDYGVTKPVVTKPKPAPVYKPTVVQKLETVKKVIPKAGNTILPVYQALTNITLSQQQQKAAEQAVTARTQALNSLLTQKSQRLAAAKTVQQKNAISASFEQSVKNANDQIEAAKTALSVQRKDAMDKAYANALAAAREALSNESSIRSEYGEKGDLAIQAIRSALIDAGDEEIETTEGSVRVK
jgi:hypothetical protein